MDNPAKRRFPFRCAVVLLCLGCAPEPEDSASSEAISDGGANARADAAAVEAEEVYHLDAGEFGNHHGGVVLVGDWIYGGQGQNRGIPTCLNLATGRIAWKGKPPARGSASVIYASGHVLFRYDRGLLAWFRAASDGCHLDGSFQPEIGDGPAWAHPVIVVARPGGSEPRGDCAASARERYARQQRREPPAIAGVQSCGQPLAPLRSIVRAPATRWTELRRRLPPEDAAIALLLRANDPALAKAKP